MILHKRVLVAIAALCFFVPRAHAQVTFTSWVHAPQITLYASVTGAGIASSGSIAADDIYSPAIPMGFSFNYFGIPYSQCVIGANGTIGFDASLSGTYDPWPISAPLLGNTSVLNSICGPWCDMDMYYTGATDGEITYFTYGTAPNRQFCANFCHNSMYSCSDQHTTAQMILYESTNVIEVHIGNKTVCSAWNGGYAIVGVQSDSAMATAVAAPGRDYPATWTATNEAWRFTPTAGGASYTVTSIPYANIPYYTVYWTDSATGAYLGSGDSIVLTPAAVTTYKAIAVSCTDTISSGLDTVGTGYMTLLPVSATSGVNTVAAVQNILLYPNPATNELYVSAGETITEIGVCNLLGQVVADLHPNSHQVTLNTSMLPPGVYLLKINGSVMRKFVKD